MGSVWSIGGAVVAIGETSLWAAAFRSTTRRAAFDGKAGLGRPRCGVQPGDVETRQNAQTAQFEYEFLHVRFSFEQARLVELAARLVGAAPPVVRTAVMTTVAGCAAIGNQVWVGRAGTRIQADDIRAGQDAQHAQTD